MPFVFDVPTTLEALHDLIERYASTGNDVSVIIERIHKANSVVLNKNNREKMQNFHDVLLRRFIEVGDAVYVSGQGGSRLCRYNQLDALSQFLFAMAQDSPACAGAVWGRRLGIQQKALAKRLRDSELWAAEVTQPCGNVLASHEATASIFLRCSHQVVILRPNPLI